MKIFEDSENRFWLATRDNGLLQFDKENGQVQIFNQNNSSKNILDKQLSDSGFNAKKFGTDMGMSRMQLHRKLAAITGLSTTEFIRSQRLKQATHILRTSDTTVNEVALWASIRHLILSSASRKFIKKHRPNFLTRPVDEDLFFPCPELSQFLDTNFTN